MRRIHLMSAALVVAAAVPLAACTGGSSGGGLGGRFVLSGNFCGAVKRFHDKTFNQGDATTIAENRKQGQAAKSAYDDLIAVAPSAIKSELQMLDRFISKLNDAAQTAASERDFENKAQGLADQYSYLVAQEHKVAAYTKQHCGITLDASG